VDNAYTTCASKQTNISNKKKGKKKESSSCYEKPIDLFAKEK
jgi:hypothetical protein